MSKHKKRVNSVETNDELIVDGAVCDIIRTIRVHAHILKGTYNDNESDPIEGLKSMLALLEEAKAPQRPSRQASQHRRGPAPEALRD
jgi:hypothetical protein